MMIECYGYLKCQEDFDLVFDFFFFFENKIFGRFFFFILILIYLDYIMFVQFLKIEVYKNFIEMMD